LETEKWKRDAAEAAAKLVRDEMVVGLGSGTTVAKIIRALAKLNPKATFVPSSSITQRLASDLGLKLSSLDVHDKLDLTIDGADEVDPRLRLIKGMGGALLREKIAASVSRQEIIAVDDSKLVDVLGTKSPLPVEVVPFGHKRAKDAIERLGCKAQLRGEKSPFITDSGNYIYDCGFVRIENPEDLEKRLNLIPGVVENGLFIGLATRVVIGTEKGVVVRERPQD
jgi:ribose 5-phosphate isomerase A